MKKATRLNLSAPCICAGSCKPMRGVKECDECMKGMIYEVLSVELADVTEHLLELEQYWKTTVTFVPVLKELKAKVRAFEEEVQSEYARSFE